MAAYRTGGSLLFLFLTVCRLYMENGKPPPIDTQRLAGDKPEKRFEQRQFPVASIEDVLREIHRAGGTGKIEINFKNGRARGDAKWRGFSRTDP